MPTPHRDRTPLLILALGGALLVLPQVIAALTGPAALSGLVLSARDAEAHWRQAPAGLALGWAWTCAPWAALALVAWRLPAGAALEPASRRRRALGLGAGVVGAAILTLLLYAPHEGRLIPGATDAHIPLATLLALPALYAGGALAARASD